MGRKTIKMMKNYLLPVFALLIVGCGNQRQQQVIFAKRLDSVNRAYITALDSMRKQHLHTVDSIKQLLWDTELKLSSAKAQHPFIRENKMDTLVRIRYKNSINGYRVSVLWQPEYVGYLGKIIGKAILNFKKGDIQFSIVHSHFFLHDELGVTSDDSIKFDKSCIHEIEYPIPEKGYFTTDEYKDSYLQKWLPFFFVGQMLALNIWAEGGKDCNCYRFYEKNYCGVYEPINYEPFISEINDFAKITGREIIVTTLGMTGKRKIYQKAKEKYSYPKYKLVRIEEYDYFTDSVYTYKLEKRLVKKESVKQN